MPTRHRDALGAALTITKHPHGCLMVFPRSAWEQFRERIVLGNAMDVDMDASGRVLVSPELRAGAGISKDVVLLGMGAYFELWDAQVYAAQEAEAMKAEMPDVFKDFSF
jgi:MraZ protein